MARTASPMLISVLLAPHFLVIGLIRRKQVCCATWRTCHQGKKLRCRSESGIVRSLLIGKPRFCAVNSWCRLLSTIPCRSACPHQICITWTTFGPEVRSKDGPTVDLGCGRRRPVIPWLFRGRRRGPQVLKWNPHLILRDRGPWCLRPSQQISFAYG